jgi:hypothetical protein
MVKVPMIPQCAPAGWVGRSTAGHCCVLIIPPGGDACKVEGCVADEKPTRYGAYLLRCWEVRSDRPGQPRSWRFSLEKAGTGERRAFRDLESLVAFLDAELGRGIEKPIEEPS